MGDAPLSKKGSSSATQREIEVKLPIADPPLLRRKLCSMGFKVVAPRFHELNLVLDTPGKDLARRNRLLRLRRGGDRITLTTKAPPPAGQDQAGYKVRREIEVAVSDFDAALAILETSGFEVVFVYEKFREILQNGGVAVMLDETPVGNFMEIEGEPDAIDSLAAQLGFQRQDYITANYRSLYHLHGGTGDMRFSRLPDEHSRD